MREWVRSYGNPRKENIIGEWIEMIWLDPQYLTDTGPRESWRGIHKPLTEEEESMSCKLYWWMIDRLEGKVQWNMDYASGLGMYIFSQPEGMLEMTYMNLKDMVKGLDKNLNACKLGDMNDKQEENLR